MEELGPEQIVPEKPELAPAAVVEKPRTNRFRPLVWIVVVLVLVLVGYIYLNQGDSASVAPSNNAVGVDTSDQGANIDVANDTVTANDEVNEAEATPTSVQTSAATTSASASSWKDYTNTELGFAFTFTDSWEGFKAEPEKNTTKVVHFYAPNNDGTYEDIFAVVRQTYGEYQTNLANNYPVGSVIYQDPTWVYTRQRRFDMYETSKLKYQITETDILAVINSFKKL